VLEIYGLSPELRGTPEFIETSHGFKGTAILGRQTHSQYILPPRALISPFEVDNRLQMDKNSTQSNIKSKSGIHTEEHNYCESNKVQTSKTLHTGKPSIKNHFWYIYLNEFIIHLISFDCYLFKRTFRIDVTSNYLLLLSFNFNNLNKSMNPAESMKEPTHLTHPSNWSNRVQE
jgi:hypothetical protein